jgi:hypothetical protein
MDFKSVGMLHSIQGINIGLAPPFVVMGVTLICIWLLHLLLKQINHRRRLQAVLPPGSMGLPLLGETLEFFSRSPALDLLPFFKRRMER